MTVFHEYGVAGILGQYSGFRPYRTDDGRPNEDCFDRSRPGPLGKAGIGIDINYPAVNLPAVGVPFNCQIDQAETLLRRVGNSIGQQNRSRAGPEDRLLTAKVGQWLEQIFSIEQLQHGGAFAARNNQPVKTREVSRGTNVHGLSAGAFHGFTMGFEITLQGEDAYFFHKRDPDGGAVLPAPGLHQFALLNFRDLQTGHADAKFLAGFKKLIRILVKGCGFDDGAGAQFRVIRLEDT